MIFNKRFFILIILSGSIFLLGLNSCKNGSSSNRDSLVEHLNDSTIGHVVVIPKKNKKVFENEPSESDISPLFKAKNYEINPDKSELEWFCGSHTGFVRLKNGTFSIENGDFNTGVFEIDMDSIYSTDIENDLMRGTLDNILKSKELFEVSKFPDAEFRILEVKNLDGNEFALSGDLKIKNKINQIEFSSLIDIESDTLKAISKEIIIDRTEWGITNMSRKFTKNKDEFIVSDSIRFIVHITAIAKKD